MSNADFPRLGLTKRRSTDRFLIALTMRHPARCSEPSRNGRHAAGARPFRTGDMAPRSAYRPAKLAVATPEELGC